jgi:hypothetical protein
VITRTKLAAGLATAAVAVPLSLFMGMGSASAVCTNICGGGGGLPQPGAAGATHALTVLQSNPDSGAPGVVTGDPDEGGQLSIIAILIGL